MSQLRGKVCHHGKGYAEALGLISFLNTNTIPKSHYFAPHNSNCHEPAINRVNIQNI